MMEAGALEKLRRLGARENPARIVSSCKRVLAQGSVDEAERWSLREQMFLAALDTHELDTCTTLLAELEAQFPSSQRVMRLKGLLHEAKGETRQAAAVYDEIIKINPSNTIGEKRKIALLIGAGKLQDAIKELSKYLERFCSDGEAWKQLAQLYIEAGLIKYACFCFEEWALTQPHSYLSSLAIAECLYSIGGQVENIVDARKYYAQSLVSKPTNARGLWGLAVTTVALNELVEESSGKSKQEIKDTVDANKNGKLNSTALNRLANTRYAPGMDELVQSALKRFSIS